MTGQAQRDEPDARRARSAIPPSTGSQNEQTPKPRRNRVAQPKATDQIQYANLKELFLDPRNPRLRQSADGVYLSQEALNDRMKDWSLEVLARSFLENGFWPHEAVLCAIEEIDGGDGLVVIEGNRRVAALKQLKKTYDGEESAPKWRELIKDVNKPVQLFEKIPYILLSERGEADAFLGFRHVTGIKEWESAENARFIAKLIDENGMNYREVMRKIGSKSPTVEQNYIAHCLLMQMEEVEDIDVEKAQERFFVLSRSMRSENVRRFLGIEEKFGIAPTEVMPLVRAGKIKQLQEYALWFIGSREKRPVLNDSRDLDRLCIALGSDNALEYMRSVSRPHIDRAFVIAGGERDETLELLVDAAHSLEQALSTIHLYKDDQSIVKASIRIISGAELLQKNLEPK